MLLRTAESARRARGVQMRDVEKRLDRGTAALIHQEMRLLNLCCCDPGAPIGQHLALPLLQARALPVLNPKRAKTSA